VFGPRLSGALVRLRPPTPGDLRSYRRWFTDPAVSEYWWTRHTRWAARPGLAALLLYLHGRLSSTAILWTIERNGRPIGHCHIRRIDRERRQAVTAVLIGEAADRGKGYGYEAVTLRSAFAFERLGLEVLRSSTMGKNAASRRMLEKAGYRQIGSTRGGAPHAAGRENVLLFEQTRSDYERCLSGSSRVHG
jgi:RimJ/RimL family protein N-acetyltransferase